MDLFLVLGVIALIIVGLVWLASRTYAVPGPWKVAIFIGLWLPTTFIGAMVWAVAVIYFRRTRGIPAPKPDVPIAGPPGRPNDDPQPTGNVSGSYSGTRPSRIARRHRASSWRGDRWAVRLCSAPVPSGYGRGQREHATMEPQALSPRETACRCTCLDSSDDDLREAEKLAAAAVAKAQAAATKAQAPAGAAIARAAASTAAASA